VPTAAPEEDILEDPLIWIVITAGIVIGIGAAAFILRKRQK
jgi:hypothetical protein